MSPGAVLPVEPVPSVHVTGEALEFGPDYDAVVKEALLNRPEILESNAQIAAAERGIVYARRSALPSLNFGASYVYQPDATALAPQHQGSLQLNLDVPLFDGGLARARNVEARADLATAQINRRTQADQVALEVQQAYVTIAQARDRVQVANVGLAQAQEAFRLAKVRSTAGLTQQPTVSPQLELSDAQTALTQAETNRLNALYDYNLARSMLDRAAGRYAGPMKRGS
jgi:outer membrane protein TolC